MKYLTGISHGFDKCTKATLQNNYFCRIPPDDCFCLEKRARYHYNKKRRKFKTVFICRSSRKLLILYYLWKKFFKFSNAQKKVFHAFTFRLCSTANSKFSFYISLYEINCIRIRTMNLVLNLSILAEILCVLFTVSHNLQRLKKKFKLVKLFFSHTNEIKSCSLVQQLILGILKDLFLQSHDFQLLNGDPPTDKLYMLLH